MQHGHRQQVRVRAFGLRVAPAQPRHGNAPAEEGQEQQEPVAMGPVLRSSLGLVEGWWGGSRLVGFQALKLPLLTWGILRFALLLEHEPVFWQLRFESFFLDGSLSLSLKIHVFPFLVLHSSPPSAPCTPSCSQMWISHDQLVNLRPA